MDDRVKATLYKVVKLAQENPEFGMELRKALGKASSANSGNNMCVSEDVQAIREALEIRALNSINYDFITEERLRNQLYIDNLRMENAALNLKENESYRFFVFCVNAFYQIENIINYYYFKRYNNVDEIIDAIVEATSKDENGKYAYRPTGHEETVGDIVIASKLNAFSNSFMSKEKMKLINLRQVRNEGEHRCMIIINQHDEANHLYKFFKYNSFNDIRILLKKLIKEVEKQLRTNGKI